MKTFRYRLYPSKNQKVLLAKHFGCVRWVYNYGLSEKKRVYQESSENLSIYEISGKLKNLKKEEKTKWLGEVNAQSLQAKLRDLDAAFNNFFNRRARFPHFKSKRNKQSFRCPQNVKINFNVQKLYIPKFREGIRAVIDRRFTGKIKNCTISQTPCGRYYVSICVEDSKDIKKPLEPTEEGCLGLDLGISSYVTDSKGNKVENPKYLKKHSRKLKWQQRKLSRKKKGSQNRKKQRIKLARQHTKVSDSRKDFLHKLSHRIAENQSYNCVAMETLSIKEMMKDSYLAGYIGDAGWFMFQCFLKYKLADRGKSLIKLDHYLPTSRLCSCRYKNDELKLQQRKWTCIKCGRTHDRDILAAQNIKKFAVGRGIPEFTPLETGDSQSLN